MPTIQRKGNYRHRPVTNLDQGLGLGAQGLAFTKNVWRSILPFSHHKPKMLGQFCFIVLTLVLNLVKTDLRCHCICKFNIFKL